MDESLDAVRSARPTASTYDDILLSTVFSPSLLSTDNSAGRGLGMACGAEDAWSAGELRCGERGQMGRIRHTLLLRRHKNLLVEILLCSSSLNAAD